jgi:hypothetical protein
MDNELQIVVDEESSFALMMDAKPSATTTDFLSGECPVITLLTGGGVILLVNFSSLKSA